jgi:secondary thiamine-phosphate synthase enzyme
VEVELLVQLGDEAVGAVTVSIEIPQRCRGGRHGWPRIVRVREIAVQTERKTQLVNITAQVNAALGEEGDGAAALVYVPHTTAGVTINEKIDPALVDDFEDAFHRIVGEDWQWRHNDADGPNAPAHVRASLISPQVLVPLSDGKLALGTYQGIFFCEFDGPRRRKVYVSTLR